jgi:hypothetical protein
MFPFFYRLDGLTDGVGTRLKVTKCFSERWQHEHDTIRVKGAEWSHLGKGRLVKLE